MLNDKTATESLTILKNELDGVIYVPKKKHGKRSKKNHLSEEAFKKIIYKHYMWRVYKHTGKDQYYGVYKEALNAGTKRSNK